MKRIITIRFLYYLFFTIIIFIAVIIFLEIIEFPFYDRYLGDFFRRIIGSFNF